MAFQHPASAKQLAYGCWLSPISTSLITKDSVSIDEIQLCNNTTYWIEKRPLEQGRCVIVQYDSGAVTDCLPDGFSSRSRVHEYGGASYIVTIDGIYFINDADQQIYHIQKTDIGKGIKPQKITRHKHCRFSDMVNAEQNKQLICICEDHTDSGNEPVNTIVAINTHDGDKTVLTSGYSFYSNPIICEKKQQLAWICWNHPNMPWDGTELWVAGLSVNKIDHSQKIAGGDNVSICQPRWSPSGILTFVSDESGWWNIYQHRDEKSHCLYPMQAEFGTPQWVFGQSSYQFASEHIIHCIVTENSIDFLGILNLSDKTLSRIDTPLTTLSSLQTSGTSTWLIGSSSTCPPQVTRLANIKGKNQTVKSIKSSYTVDVDSGYLSTGENIQFTTRHDDVAFAIYYAPRNQDFTSSGLPPLIVLSHGGPTACTSNAFDIRKQYWTSRGFAIIDVNYSGSTGFGRDYRERLTNNWGIRDAEDCCDAALYAVQNNLADPEQLIIKGGSAGGYTVLCALTFHNVFSAGASYYGIGELASLARDTHKFESRYLDKLVGTYPENKQTYLDRSPIHHVDQLNCPVIFFQGEDDHVVPKQQAEKMVAAIESKGIPVAYLLFKGESHGFRKSKTIEDTLNAEYLFYSKIFNFDITEPLRPITIKNL